MLGAVHGLTNHDAKTRLLVAALGALKLEMKPEKTERAVFDPAHPETFQYLGFNISPEGTLIRPGSLSRQWRRARRKLRQTLRIGSEAVASGKAVKIYTRKLRRRFLPVGVRNFSSYARRAAAELGSKKMVKQVRRLERMVEAGIREMGS